MKRTSLVFLPWLAAAVAACAAPVALAEPPSLQSRIDLFESCIEQAILAQRRLEPGARSADAVRGHCVAHRAALEPVLGAGARAVVDTAVSRRISTALGGADAAPSPAP